MPSLSLASSSVAYRSSTYCDSTTTPVPGYSARIRLATVMPSTVYVGGIRISVSTASGASSATAAINAPGSSTSRTSVISATSAKSAAVPSRIR